MLGESTRQGTRARARRENDEEDVDCGDVLEHIHHALIINSNGEYMLARAEGNSRSPKLDELLIIHDYSWSTFWSRPQADDEVPIEPCEAVRCWKGTLPTCSAARGQYRVNFHTETLDGSSSQKLGLDTAMGSAGEPWSRALTTR